MTDPVQMQNLDQAVRATAYYLHKLDYRSAIACLDDVEKAAAHLRKLAVDNLCPPRETNA